MTRIARRRLLKLSGSGAVAAHAGGMAAILASGRAPALAQEQTVHWLRWTDFVPASDALLKGKITQDCKKATGINLKLETVNANDLQSRITSGIQSGAGADIIMAFDDCPPSATAGSEAADENDARLTRVLRRDDVQDAAEYRKRVRIANERTARWLERGIGAHKRKHEQSLFGIVQGGTLLDLHLIWLTLVAIATKAGAILSTITQQSAERLQLHAGAPVFALVKATSFVAH